MPAEWLQQVPEDIRGEAALQTVPDIGTLAKNYLNAEKLIGQQRLPAPQTSWGDKEWGEFYSKIGRPEKPEGYSVPSDIKFEEGVKFDDERMGAARKKFHELGLTPKQADGMIRYYAESLNTSVKSQRTAEEASVAKSMNELRTELGDKFDEGVDLAKGVVRKFGSPELVEFLNTTRLGDNPHLVRALMKIGTMMAEDTARGSGRDLLLKDTTHARVEVDRLAGDSEFQKMLNDRDNPGHKAAIERWNHAFRSAYPGKTTEQD